MKQMLVRILMVSGVTLVSGALALGQRQMPPQQQQQPGSATPQQEPNPGLNSPTMEQQQNGAMSQMQDKAFLRKALEGNMAEVQLGQLAQQKSNSDDVKQFGAKMVQDHTQLMGAMKPIMEQMGVSAPTSLSKKDEALMDKLQGMSGTQFDDAYIKAMVKDHENDLMETRREADHTQDPQLKEAAQHAAQVVDGHLKMIKEIAKAHHVKG